MIQVARTRLTDEVSASTPVETAARAVLARHFETMLSNVTGARRGDDPEDIHDMRVAGRRLRAALRMFGPWLGSEAGRLDAEVKWIMRMLGSVRDLDVQLALIQARGAPDAAEPILALLRRKRDGAHQRLVAALSSVRFRRMINAFDKLVDAEAPGTVTLGEVAVDLVRGPREQLRRSMRSARKTGDDEHWHKVRIRVKRLRYSVEALSALSPRASKDVLGRLERAQDALGAFNDAAVGCGIVEALRRNARLPGRSLDALAHVGEQLAAERRKARAAVERMCAPVKGRHWNELERTLRLRRRPRGGMNGMEIILVRHAIAGDADARQWPDDAARPLTEEGERAFRKAARGAAEVVGTPDLVLASPFARAWRTAELMTEEALWPTPVEAPELEPGGSSVEVLKRLTAAARVGRVALVGHEPNLSRLASWLLTGSETGLDAALKKGGIVSLEFDDEPHPGAGTLRLWLAPKALRAIGA